MSSRRKDERGAALLVVMVAVAVLTILAAQLAYDTRVSLRIAANARDELRATYLAKSGVNLSRLVLSFQQQIDERVQPTAATAVAMPRVLIWRLVPVGSTLTGSLFGEGAPAAAHGETRPAPAGEAEAPAAPAPAAAGEGFDAAIDDESRKVNVQLEALGAGVLGAQVQALYQLVCDARWDPLFDREDGNGQRVSRQDLLLYLHDWVDTDEQGSALSASFPAAGCSIMLTGAKPFEAGFQDENYAYDRGEDRYRAKNSWMDSLDELYMIAGVGDAFMAAFGDSLTVYLKPGAQRNLNETDKKKLLENAALIADPPIQQALLDPKFADMLEKEVALRTFHGMLSMSPSMFGQIVETCGVTVNRILLTGSSSPFTDRSTVFGIRAEGRAGAVTKTLDVVVSNEKAQGLPTPAPGRILHWREE